MSSSALEPIRIGSVELRNRIVMSATVNNLGLNLRITDELIAFYTERARGGVGAIVTEGLSVHETSIPNPTVPLAFDERVVPGFAKLAESVHEAGAALFGQLWHVGRQALWNPSLAAWGVSGMRDPYSGSTPHVMTTPEIREVIAGFVRSAVNLERAGFDGVELHGAHGYLLTQFLSPLSNTRTDEWGGSLENRSRFVVELITGIRKAVGAGFVVGIKLPAHEYVDGGIDLEEAQAITAYLVNTARPDFFATGQGNFSPSLEKHVPDMHFPDMAFVHLPAGIRAVADGVPVMAITKIPDVASASRLIDDGAADFIGTSRALLADAHLVRKTIEGLPPRPCVYCNVCWDYIHTGRAVACIYAPETGREWESSLVPPASGKSLTVHVIGAGPAGLEYARTALERGNRVHVHEAGGAIGGRLHEEAGVPGRETMQKAVDWYAEEIARLGGVISLNDRVDLEDLTRLDGDVTVVAIGDIPVVDKVLGLENVMSIEDAIVGRSSLEGPVVIVDEIEGDLVYAVAEALAAQGLSVSIVTRRASIGRRVPYINIIGILRRLDEAGVTIYPMSLVDRVEGGSLVIRHALSNRETVVGAVATVVRAGPYRTPLNDQSLFDAVIGDASAPRDVLAAVREANVRASGPQVRKP